MANRTKARGRIQIELSPPLKARLEMVRDRTGIPITRMVEDALSQHLELLEPILTCPRTGNPGGER